MTHHGGSSTSDYQVSSKEWELIQSVDEEKLKVEKYKSKRTNLTVVLGHTESPIVNGYFCLATEAFDDDGLPHTLEHLIFRGSEDYPYKEMLDNLATRYPLLLTISMYSFLSLFDLLYAKIYQTLFLTFNNSNK